MPCRPGGRYGPGSTTVFELVWMLDGPVRCFVDGAEFELTLGTDLMITNLSSHELDNDADDIVSFHFELLPNVTLENDTDILFDFDLTYAIGKNPPVIDGPIFGDTIDIYSTTVGVFNETFSIAGITPQTVNFVV